MTPPDDLPSPDERHRHRVHRTWPERLAIAGTFMSALLCFAIAAALVGSYLIARQRNIADFQNPANLAAAETISPPGQEGSVVVLDTIQPTTTSTEPGSAASAPDGSPPNDVPAASIAGNDAPDDRRTTTTTVAAPGVTFPEADPEASNFLITGADSGACVDPESPYAGTFGDREGMGERSDTIMVLRVDPAAKRVAILSFPRDLYVEIADGGGMSRINAAYERGAPQRLADTIYNNFDIPIDHFIQVDFCAFKTLVDAVGGVAVPFDFPARDDNTGLIVPEAGCFTFDGEHALAYVRSRKYQYEDPPGSGNWSTDPTSDLGRISRQQDFLRRTLASLLDKGPLNPRVARGLIRAATEYITTDRNLTPAKMMEFAGVMNDVDPTTILTYQIEASGRTIGGAAVLIPNTESEHMQVVLAIFRGETSLADAVEQVFSPTTAAAPRGSSTTAAPDSSIPDSSIPDSSVPESSVPESSADGTVSSDADDTTPPDSSAAESTDVEATIVEGDPVQDEFGIVPPRDQVC